MDPGAIMASIEGLFSVFALFVGAMAAVSTARYVIWRKGYCVGNSCK